MSVTKRAEIGIVRIGLRREVEQVERAAGSGGQIGRDRRDDAARRAGDQEDGVACPASAGLAVGCGLFLEPDRPAQAVLVADLDRAGIAQRFVDQEFGDFRRGRGPASKSTALTSASGRSRL